MNFEGYVELSKVKKRIKLRLAFAMKVESENEKLAQATKLRTKFLAHLIQKSSQMEAELATAQKEAKGELVC